MKQYAQANDQCGKGYGITVQLKENNAQTKKSRAPCTDASGAAETTGADSLKPPQFDLSFR